MGQKVRYTLGKLSVYHRVQDKNAGREFINGIVIISIIFILSRACPLLVFTSNIKAAH